MQWGFKQFVNFITSLNFYATGSSFFLSASLALRPYLSEGQPFSLAQYHIIRQSFYNAVRIDRVLFLVKTLVYQIFGLPVYSNEEQNKM